MALPPVSVGRSVKPACDDKAGRDDSALSEVDLASALEATDEAALDAEDSASLDDDSSSCAKTGTPMAVKQTARSIPLLGR